MDKSALTETIAGRLEALGLPVQRGQGTDLSAHQEFLTAGWSSGNKTITYETAILLDEAHRTVYMHERTAEVGSGLSFGADSESSFQSGTTLMRKVRSVQYGPEGRAYEVDLDLGAIPKAVKESAREQGWDFTTVLRRSKALYGDRPQSAYTPEPAVAAAVPPPAEPVSNGAGRPPAPPLAPTPAAPPAPPADPSSARPGKGRLIAVVALGVVAALLLLLIGAGVVGWAVSIVVVVGVFLLLRILPAGAVGGVLTAVLCVAAAGVVFVAGALTAPPSTEVAAPADAGATGAATPAASAPGAGDAASSGFQFVSGDLTTDVNLSFDDAAGYDQTVVAVAHVEHNVGEAGEADIDMTIAYSTDGGATWSWGGTLVAPGEQWPEAVMMDPKGAIVVGWQRTRDGDETGPSQAFIAAAMAPDFVPQEIPAPAEFTGGRYVDLYDIANVDGTWVIVGTVIDDAIRSAIWRSSDEGTTWTKQVVATTGLASFAASRLVVGPDGSWNLIGAGQRSNGATFTAAWLRSADGGRTFTAVQPEAFTSDANEAALQLVLSDNGGAALLASSEAPDGGYLNALWVSNSDGVMQRLGSANLPSQEGSDLNLGGIMFFDDTLLAYGSPRGMTYGDTVQFWAMAQDGTWSPGTQVVTPATSFIKQVIIGGDTALALGLHDDGSGYDSIGVWRGSLVAPND